MKVFFLTPQSPEVYGGGASVILGHLIALSRIVGRENLFYIGPKSNTVKIQKLATNIFVEPSSRTSYIRSLLLQRSFIRYSRSILIKIHEIRQEISDNDIFFIESTKIGSLIQRIKDMFPRTNVFSFVHNDETAYYKQSERLFGFAFKQAIEYEQNMSLLYSDTVLSIKGIRLPPGYDHKIVYIEPFTYISTPCPSDVKKYGKLLAFSGSFKFEHNMEGLLKVIKSTRKLRSKHDFMLLITGSGFFENREISKALKNEKNILVSNNPKNERFLLSKAIFFINPEVSNGGVLIKNLIALSCRTPIIGFRESFKGYTFGRYFLIINDLEEIELVLNKSDSFDIYQRSIEAAEYFERELSLSAGKRRLEQIIYGRTK